MTSATLHAYGNSWRIDTADDSLVGPWIKALVEELQPKDRRMPIEFRLVIQ